MKKYIIQLKINPSFFYTERELSSMEKIKEDVEKNFPDCELNYSEVQ